MHGVSGRLISSSFAADVLPELSGIREPPPDLVGAYVRWNAVREARLGPASGVRAIADIAALPFFDLLGFRAVVRVHNADRCELALTHEGAAIPAIVTPWSHPLDGIWRDAVRLGIASDARWCLCTNGRTLRIVDAQRTWSRNHLDLDLAAAAHLPDACRVLWTIARAEAMLGPDPLLDRAVKASAQHGSAICRSLAAGVLEALGIVLQALSGEERRARGTPAPLEQSLTVLYRVLFLLFAEARGLVPVWHPIYRDRYTIDSILEAVMAGRRCRGVWRALQAIARLAHTGCHAGDLHVTAFNGRLFSPLHTPSAEQRQLDDEAMGRALLAVGTAPGRRGGRARIRYRDLDVEQLGAVYEHVLDYEAGADARRMALRRSGDARKASGTFYTPRSMTGYLVRRTLAPLVSGRSADEILALRIVDPAMGSGAFLVAACGYLAGAVEAARLRDGEWHADEATPEARVLLRRQVAQQCLFGVDLNPMAVQLARLSLWLATLAGDRPLTFLDHRLAVGDSTVGATLADVLARPPGGTRRRSPRSLPLFDADGLGAMVRDVADIRVRLALERDDDAAVVRRKEATLAAVRHDGSAFVRWKALLELWCGCWFVDERRPDGPLFRALSDVLLGRTSSLPPHVALRWTDRMRAVSDKQRFFHWELEFPEVFFDAQGSRSPSGGFDAVVGNPPWDMVRGDSGDGPRREARRAEARQLLDFVRGSGVYTSDGRAHVNRYQLFVERSLQIVKPGGRIGLVLPSGVVSDAGSAPLRRHLFDRADVDSVVGLDNREGIFPIHRSVRFVLLTATAGRPTDRVACRFGVTNPAQLDDIEEHEHDARSFPVSVSRPLLSRLSGPDDLAIPELATSMDLRIVEKISAAHPWLSADDGWNVRFARELNASDDRGAFVPATHARASRPVLEGKHVTPFRVAVDNATHELASAAAFRVRVPRRVRLAYRDVASASNRLTLIAALVPARAVTTHTLFCLRTPLALDRQLALCALLNSFVANYLVRLRVNTHVTLAITSRLPVPVLEPSDPVSVRLTALARTLSDADAPVETMREYVELQALAAHAYDLSRDELAHVLATFPLIPEEVKVGTLALC